VRGRDSQSPTPARRRVRDDKGGPPVSDRGGGRRSGPCWAKSGAGLRKSRGACGGLAEKTREHGRTSADGLGPKELIGVFYFFPNSIFNAKSFPGNPRKCFKAQKILRKFQKC
jgi:hypothetical protein